MTIIENIVYAIRRWFNQMKLLLGFEIVRCNRCNSTVEPSELKDYTYQCLECDEDLFTFETYVERKG